MAGTKISQMNPAEALAQASVGVDATVIAAVSAGANYKMTRRFNRRYLTGEGTPVHGDVLRWGSNANAYNSAYIYERGDLVTSGANLYRAVQQSGPAPLTPKTPGTDTAYWVSVGADTEIGDWVARPLTHAAPTEGQVPVWDTSLPVADWTATGTRWRVIDASRYTEAASRAAPSTTSAFEFSSDPATYGIRVGVPLRWEYPANTYYYGIVTAATSTLVTVSGPSIDLAQAIVSLAVGTPEMVHVEKYMKIDNFDSNTSALNGAPPADVNGLLARSTSTVTNRIFSRWAKSPAYLVAYAGTVGVTAGTAKINPTIAGMANVVGTEGSGAGITLSGTAGTWVSNAAASIDSTKYDIVRGDRIEIAFTTGGSSGGKDLNIELTFVLE